MSLKCPACQTNNVDHVTECHCGYIKQIVKQNVVEEDRATKGKSGAWISTAAGLMALFFITRGGVFAEFGPFLIIGSIVCFVVGIIYAARESKRNMKKK